MLSHGKNTPRKINFFFSLSLRVNFLSFLNKNVSINSRTHGFFHFFFHYDEVNSFQQNIFIYKTFFFNKIFFLHKKNIKKLISLSHFLKWLMFFDLYKLTVLIFIWHTREWFTGRTVIIRITLLTKWQSNPSLCSSQIKFSFLAVLFAVFPIFIFLSHSTISLCSYAYENDERFQNFLFALATISSFSYEFFSHIYHTVAFFGKTSLRKKENPRERER